jgi:tripartite-type tricarboxylate transporter receptor subunit TctC
LFLHFFGEMMRRKLIVSVGLLAVAAVSSFSALAQSSTTAYPTKPIKLIVPTAAGGGYDNIGRLMAEKLGTELGNQWVVENRTGAGTVVGTQAAARAPADGYTLVVGGLANIAFNPGLYEKLPYNPSTDLVPIALVGSFSYTLVGNKDIAQNSLRELIDFARANPGKLTIAHGGVGTGQHVAAALLKSLAKIDILEVPYKGAQAAYTDLLGGRVDLFFDNTTTVRPFVDTARAKALATSSSSREALLPQVSTGQEAGLPGLVLESWIGLFAPANTPPANIEKLRVAVANVMLNTDIRKRLEATGVRTFSMNARETERFVKSETDKWTQFLRQAGIKAE